MKLLTFMCGYAVALPTPRPAHSPIPDNGELDQTENHLKILQSHTEYPSEVDPDYVYQTTEVPSRTQDFLQCMNTLEKHFTFYSFNVCDEYFRG